MKFYKRKNLDQVRPKDEGFYQSIAGDLITNSTSSMQLPSGTMESRPIRLENGIIRYNQDLKELEAFIDGTWERIRTVRPSEIVVQDFGDGDYVEYIFAPLNKDYNESYKKGSANILVYVDNVYQIPEVNYTIQSGSISTSMDVVNDVLPGSTQFEIRQSLPIDIVGWDVTQSSSPYIQIGTTVTAYNPSTKTVTISKPTAGGTISAGTYINFESLESYGIVFTEPPPNKPIRVILGYDGYFPPLVTI